MKSNLRLASTFAALLLAAAPAFTLACKCVPPPPPKQALEKAAAVFVGTVVAENKEKKPGGRELELEVSGVWKGALPKRITVYTATDSAACGFPFQLGETYVVYTYLDGDRHLTNLCTRTALKTNATEDLKALGEPRAPQ